MGTLDPRVDAYIAKSADFARPILVHLRETIHAASPVIDETLKWSAPHFTHCGLLCGMAAFKRHVTFGFWLGEQVTGSPASDTAMGQFGRLTCIADLPSRRTLIAHVRNAIALNEAGVKAPRRAHHGPAPAPVVPDDLAAALRRDAKARAAFDAFSPSHRREYIEWIEEAKRAATRAQRLATTLAWLAQGKPRNWKYMKQETAGEPR